MSNVIEVVYERGTFRPTKKLHIKEHEKALLILKTGAKTKGKNLFGTIPNLRKFSEKDRADSK